MKKLNVLLSCAALVVSPGLHAMVVHEWGTFTSLQGSNGQNQMGIYREEEFLPDFVHGLGETILKPNQPSPLPIADDDGCSLKNIPCSLLRTNQITQRMETPVIYFYHDGPSAQKVSIEVGFPEGVISETFPAPVEAFPDAKAVNLTRGQVRFEIEVRPRSEAVQVPFVDGSNIYSHARNVNSNYVTAGTENEKFIFYRGVGKFQGSLSVTSSSSAMIDALTFQNIGGSEEQPIREMILVHTDASGGTRVLDLMKAVQRPSLPSGSSFDFTNDSLKQFLQSPVAPKNTGSRLLAQALVRTGLRFDEAQAMVDTWAHGYFQTPGLRVLYILSPEAVERILPMNIQPTPEELLRVMVGRVEILTADEELRILQLIQEQGLSFPVASLGRFREAKLKAVQSRALRSPALYPAQFLQNLTDLISRAQ